MIIGWRRLVIDEVISLIQCSLSPHATVVSVMTEYHCFKVFSSPHATVVLVMTEYLCFNVSSSPFCNSCVNDDGIPLLQCFLVSTWNCCVSDDGITFVSMFSGFGRNRMCKEIVEIQRGDCSDLGDIMSICRDINRVSMFGRYYGKCLKENNVDSFKVCTVFLA